MNKRNSQEGLQYIPIIHDPSRKVFVSSAPSKVEIAAKIISGIINIGSSLILCGCSMAMVYLVARIMI